MNLLNLSVKVYVEIFIGKNAKYRSNINGENVEGLEWREIILVNF